MRRKRSISSSSYLVSHRGGVVSLAYDVSGLPRQQELSGKPVEIPLHGGIQCQVRSGGGRKGSAFRRPTRSDLEWIFTVQTERAVAKDNTFTLQNQIWQIDQTRWRHSLAGCTVSIHEHLDETISVRYEPHVVGRYHGTETHY